LMMVRSGDRLTCDDRAVRGPTGWVTRLEKGAARPSTPKLLTATVRLDRRGIRGERAREYCANLLDQDDSRR